jgi:uncharacterized phage infection (PIP) family protein YhgE
VAILRELVTKLSFKVDQKNLDKFEKSILGFKTKVSLAVAGITGAIYKVGQFLGDISDSAISVKNISDYAGIAVSEFDAMRKGAQDLGTSFETFDKLSLTLSNHIRDSRVATGKLFDLWRAFPNKVNLPKFVDQADDFKSALEGISNVIEGLPNRSDKLAGLANFFQVDINQANEILRFLEDYKGKFQDAVKANEFAAKQFAQQVPDLEKYSIEIGKLSGAFTTFKTVLAGQLAPAATGIVQGATNILRQDERLAADIDEFVSELSTSGRAFVEATNTFNFNVEPGSRLEQATQIYDYVKEALEEVFSGQIRDVVINNPQLE